MPLPLCLHELLAQADVHGASVHTQLHNNQGPWCVAPAWTHVLRRVVGPENRGAPGHAELAQDLELHVTP